MSAALLLVLAAAAFPAVTLEAQGCPALLSTTVRDELEASGFSTSLTLDTAPHVAAIAMQCDLAHITLQLEDRVTSKAVSRTVPRLEGPRSEAHLAVQVVELLHASLAETRFAALTQVPSVERFLAAREGPPRSSPWNASVGFGLHWAVGGFGAQPSVAGEVSRAVYTFEAARVELGGLVTATVHPTSLQSEEGTAEVGLLESRALVAMRFERGTWALRPRLSLGALWVWANGHSVGRAEAAFEVTATFQGSMGVSVSRAITPWLALSLGTDLAVAPFPVRVVVFDTSTRVGLLVLSLHGGVVFR